jgi:hypothetical protein
MSDPESTNGTPATTSGRGYKAMPSAKTCPAITFTQQRADRVVAAVKKVSDQVGRSMAQVALAWLRHRAVPVIPILGARKLTQLQDNLASFDLALSPEHVKILDAASPVDLGFPQELYAKEFPRRPPLRRHAWPNCRLNSTFEIRRTGSNLRCIDNGR